jgi:hypothetical protein
MQYDPLRRFAVEGDVLNSGNWAPHDFSNCVLIHDSCSCHTDKEIFPDHGRSERHWRKVVLLHVFDHGLEMLIKRPVLKGRIARIVIRDEILLFLKQILAPAPPGYPSDFPSLLTGEAGSSEEPSVKVALSPLILSYGEYQLSEWEFDRLRLDVRIGKLGPVNSYRSSSRQGIRIRYDNSWPRIQSGNGHI